MRALITGGAGFIGSNIADRLVSEGHEVIVLDNLSTGYRANVPQNAKFIECDIRNYETILPHFQGVEVVFHTAALARIQPSITDPLLTNDVNITGTLNVLWAAHQSGVKKVIYCASSSAYGDQPEDAFPLKESLPTHPGSPYAVQKLVGEMYCELFSKLYKLPTVRLRYFNVYGPKQITEGAYAAVVGIFIKQRLEGKPMTLVGDGTQRRDYTHVHDVAEANILAWQKDLPPGVLINIGSGKNYSINELASLVGGPTINIPPRPGEYRITLADVSKAKNLLGWAPKYNLEQGVAELKKLHGL